MYCVANKSNLYDINSLLMYSQNSIASMQYIWFCSKQQLYYCTRHLFLKNTKKYHIPKLLLLLKTIVNLWCILVLYFTCLPGCYWIDNLISNYIQILHRDFIKAPIKLLVNDFFCCIYPAYWNIVGYMCVTWHVRTTIIYNSYWNGCMFL